MVKWKTTRITQAWCFFLHHASIVLGIFEDPRQGGFCNWLTRVLELVNTESYPIKFWVGWIIPYHMAAPDDPRGLRNNIRWYCSVVSKFQWVLYPSTSSSAGRHTRLDLIWGIKWSHNNPVNREVSIHLFQTFPSGHHWIPLGYCIQNFAWTY